MIEIDVYLNHLLQLEALKDEGKDVGDLRAVVEEKVFEEADARLSAFFKARREIPEREYCATRRYLL